MFADMLALLRERVTTLLCLMEIHSDTHAPEIQQQKPARTIETRGADLAEKPAPAQAGTFVAPEVSKNDPATWASTPRNAPCPCGSGKKYKYCHGQAT